MTRLLAVCAVLALVAAGAMLSGGEDSLLLLDRDCSDFASQQQAQAFFEKSKPGDPHGLDGDGDGVVCKMLR